MPNPTRKDQLLALLTESPEDSFLLFALAKEFEKEMEFTSAVGRYQRLIIQDPSYLGAYYHLGQLFIRIGDRDQARSTFQQGISKSLELNDLHARSELQAALRELEIGDLG
ncbi:MAG TPA: tetratricopeptide repeat protein [Saprospiraceae bacterium]|nr:tetratricopeptide repeat protein [Saprospiraceae bacterium]